MICRLNVLFALLHDVCVCVHLNQRVYLQRSMVHVYARVMWRRIFRFNRLLSRPFRWPVRFIYRRVRGNVEVPWLGGARGGV